jgi:hypothetical protein
LFESFYSSSRIDDSNNLGSQYTGKIFVSGNHNLTDSYMSFDINFRNRTRIITYDINEDNSVAVGNVLNLETYRYSFTAGYDTLLLNYFFTEASVNIAAQNAYFRNVGGSIFETLNYLGQGSLKINKRFDKKLFTSLEMQTQYLGYNNELSYTEVFQHQIDFRSVYQPGIFKFEPIYSLRQLGQDSPLIHLANVYIGITPRKSNFHFDIEILNLLNHRSLLRRSASIYVRNLSQTFIPERRFIVSAAYVF